MVKKNDKKAARREEIPAHARKMIQYMKIANPEIVSFSDEEIYGALKDHRMNQSHALYHLRRLLDQERRRVAPQSSELRNVETKKEQVLSNEGASSSNVPSSSSQQPNVEARLVPVSSNEPSSSEKQVGDSSLREKQEAPPCVRSKKDYSYFSSTPPIVFGSLHKQHHASDSVSNQNYVAYNLFASSSTEPYQVQSCPSNDQASSVATSLQQLSIDEDDESRTGPDDHLDNISQRLKHVLATSGPSNQIQMEHNPSNLLHKDPAVLQEDDASEPDHLQDSALTIITNTSNESLLGPIPPISVGTGTDSDHSYGNILPSSPFHQHGHDQTLDDVARPPPNMLLSQQHGHGGASYNNNNTYHHQQNPRGVVPPPPPPPYWPPQTAYYFPPPFQQYGHGGDIYYNNIYHQQPPPGYYPNWSFEYQQPPLQHQRGNSNVPIYNQNQQSPGLRYGQQQQQQQVQAQRPYGGASSSGQHNNRGRAI